MLGQCLQKVWFIFLMVFAICGSSITIAATKTMTHNPQRFTTTCQQHEIHQNTHHHTASISIEINSHTDCPQNMALEPHPPCQDCSLMLCQTHLYGLITTEFHFNQRILEQNSRQFSSPYNLRFTLGYAQELLRPPQT